MKRERFYQQIYTKMSRWFAILVTRDAENANPWLQWIIYTTSLRDLVLNAVALECVLVLDELLFDSDPRFLMSKCL